MELDPQSLFGLLCTAVLITVKNAVELLGAFRPDVEKIQYH